MPFHKERYPSNWPEISKRIRERAGNKCEFCGVENGAIGYRLPDGKFVKVFNSVQDVGMTADAMLLDGFKLIAIVLTVAHLNHIESDCSDGNLKALCQKCHLTYDAKHHAKNAANTRHKHKLENGQLELIAR